MLDSVRDECTRAISAVRHGLRVDRVAVLALSDKADHQVVDSHPRIDARICAPALVDAVAKTKRTVHRSIGRTQAESVAIAPIFDESGVVGVLYVARDDAGGFSEKEIRVVEAMAGQIVPTKVAPPRCLRRDTIVDAFGLDDPTSVIWADSEAQDSSGGLLLAFADPPTADAGDLLRERLEHAVQNLTAIAQSHVAAILEVRGLDSRAVVIGASPDSPNVPSSDLISQTVLDQVLWSGEPLLTIDAHGSDIGKIAQSIQKLDVTMVMCVPVVLDTETVGLVYTARFGVGSRFNQETLIQLFTQAHSLGPTLKQIRSSTRSARART